MDNNRDLVTVVSEPFEQRIRSNEVVQRSRSEVAPFVAGPQKIGDDDAQTCPGEIVDEVRPDEPGATGNDDQIVAGQVPQALLVRHYFFTEPCTTMPVITGPVIVFRRVKNFCNSLSRALAT